MSIKNKILIFIAIIAIVMVVQFFMHSRAQDHITRFETTGHGVTYDFDASPSFYSNNSQFFFHATRDSMRSLRSDATVRWTAPLSLNRPIMVARGDIVAVGEQSGGRRVYVFDNDGLLFRRDFAHPVVSFFVNESGILAVIVQYASGHGIYVFDQGTVAANRAMFSMAIHENLRYPTSVEVSADGRYIAVAILDLNTRLSTTVQFRYINEEDARGTVGGLFSSETFYGQIIHTMRFMEGHRLVIATTSQIVCHQITRGNHAVSTQREVWDIQLNNVLSAIEFYNNRYFVFVTGDRHAGAVDASPVGTVYIVNASGDTVGEYSIGRRVTHLSLGHRTVLVGADRNFHAIDFRGQHIWEHNALFDTRTVIFLGNTNTILVAGANRAEIHTRNRIRVNDFGNFTLEVD